MGAAFQSWAGRLALSAAKSSMNIALPAGVQGGSITDGAKIPPMVVRGRGVTRPTTLPVEWQMIRSLQARCFGFCRLALSAAKPNVDIAQARVDSFRAKRIPFSPLQFGVLTPD